MQTHFLFDVLDGYKPFEQMAQESQNSGAVIAASGMAGAQKAHAACALAARTGRPLLFLCDSERSATQTMEDLSALLGGGVSLLPAREITFYQDVAASREVAYRRIEAMRKVLSGDARAIVAPADALLHRMMPREVFNRNTISLRVGDVTPIDLLIERLLAAGYTREYMVEGKGQFSVRGGIIDVYPADALSAVRIEFFDDELDSIRAVDVMSQRSQGNMQEVVIPPASEAPVPQAGTEALARLLLEALAQTGAVAALSLPENKGKLALFGGIKSARFRKQVTPGDVLTLHCELVQQHGAVGVGKASAWVDGKCAVTAELTFVLTEAAE